jgi:dTDP-D-glucose 4,6-dehydratase
VITRGNNVYGEYQFPDKLIPKLINHILNDEKLPIHGKGNSRRDFIHARDKSTAVWTVLQKGVLGEIYNIGSDNEFSVLDIASKFVKEMKGVESIGSSTEYVKDRDCSDYRYCISTTKLKNLGREPKVSFETVLKRIISWYKQNPEYRHPGPDMETR